MTLAKLRTRYRVRIKITMLKKEAPNMKPNYICVNGYTFDAPLVVENLNVFSHDLVRICPVCGTGGFKRYPSLDELKDLASKTKTRVTKPGRAIQGSTMVHFKCELCDCEFESPISECNLAIVFGNYDDFQVAHHKCPNEFCGVECEESIEDLGIFGDQHG